MASGAKRFSWADENSENEGGFEFQDTKRLKQVALAVAADRVTPGCVVRLTRLTQALRAATSASLRTHFCANDARLQVGAALDTSKKRVVFEPSAKKWDGLTPLLSR